MLYRSSDNIIDMEPRTREEAALQAICREDESYYQRFNDSKPWTRIEEYLKAIIYNDPSMVNHLPTTIVETYLYCIAAEKDIPEEYQGRVPATRVEAYMREWLMNNNEEVPNPLTVEDVLYQYICYNNLWLSQKNKFPDNLVIEGRTYNNLFNNIINPNDPLYDIYANISIPNTKTDRSISCTVDGPRTFTRTQFGRNNIGYNLKPNTDYTMYMNIETDHKLDFDYCVISDPGISDATVMTPQFSLYPIEPGTTTICYNFNTKESFSHIDATKMKDIIIRIRFKDTCFDDCTPDNPSHFTFSELMLFEGTYTLDQKPNFVKTLRGLGEPLDNGLYRVAKYKVRGKNLVDPTNYKLSGGNPPKASFEGSKLSFSDDSATWSYVYWDPKDFLEVGKTYAVKATVKGAGFFFAWVQDGSTKYAALINEDEGQVEKTNFKTFTYTQEMYDLNAILRADVRKGTDRYVKDFIICEYTQGDVVNYEKYKEKNYYCDIPYQLYSTPDGSKDKLYKDNGQWVVEKNCNAVSFEILDTLSTSAVQTDNAYNIYIVNTDNQTHQPTDRYNKVFKGDKPYTNDTLNTIYAEGLRSECRQYWEDIKSTNEKEYFVTPPQVGTKNIMFVFPKRIITSSALALKVAKQIKQYVYRLENPVTYYVGNDKLVNKNLFINSKTLTRPWSIDSGSGTGANRPKEEPVYKEGYAVGYIGVSNYAASTNGKGYTVYQISASENTNGYFFAGKKVIVSAMFKAVDKDVNISITTSGNTIAQWPQLVPNDGKWHKLIWHLEEKSDATLQFFRFEPEKNNRAWFCQPKAEYGETATPFDE